MTSLKLMNLDDLIETEEHYNDDCMFLAKKIKKENYWTVPIVIEVNTNAIMDGHHRFNAAKKLGLSRVPCVVKDYKKNDVKLFSWKKDIKITYWDIYNIIKNKKKFPPKTTRHVFNPPIKETKIPLELLY